jgi:anti-sigma factor RsiW
MNCRTCRSLLLEYGERALPSDAGRELEAHLAICPGCRLELALARKIDRVLTSQPLKTPGEDFTARVLARLPARRALAPLWLQLLPPAGYAFSILVLFLGFIRQFAGMADVWNGANAAGRGLIEAELARLCAFIDSSWAAADDFLAAVASLAGQFYSIFDSHAALIYLAVALIALLGELRDRYQGRTGRKITG